MKKTLIASAVALATFASAGASAQDVKLPQIYGNIQLVTGYSDGDQVDNYWGQNGGSYDFSNNGSTLGFLHDHEIAPGLTAFFKAEFHFNAPEDAGIGGTDEAYIGVKGDFGQIWAGKDDSVYEWVSGATDLYEALGVPGNAQNTGEERLIQYSTPSFGGLTLGIAYQMNDNTGGEDAFQLAAQYELGETTTIAVAFDSGATAPDNANSYGLAVTHKLGDLSLVAQYEQQEDNVDILGVLGAYSLGKTTLMGSYHFTKFDAAGAEDSHTISLQALHNLSDNFYVYVEGQYVDNAEGTDGAEVKTLLLGATYVF